MKGRRCVLKTLLAAIAYSLLAIALSWPLLLHLDSRVIGNIEHPGCQGDLFYQYDMQQQMRAGALPTHARLVTLNHPDGLEIPAKDRFAIHLLIYAVFMTVFGLLASHNLGVLTMVVLNALSMHLLARQRFGREDFAFLSGLAFGFSSYVFLKVQQGFPQKACLFFVPLFVLFLLRALERRGVANHVLMLLCLAGVMWIYPPYAVFDVAFALPLVLYRAWRSNEFWEVLWRFAPALLVVAVLFGIVAYTQQGDSSTTSVHVDLEFWRMEGGFLAGSPFLWRPYAMLQSPPVDWVATLPLGFPIVLTLLGGVAVVLGARDARLMAAIVAGMVVVMLGPYLALGGEPGDSGALTVKLPFYYLAQLPGGGALRFPIRLFPWALVALLLAAGSGLGAIRQQLGVADHGRKVLRVLVPVLLVATALESRALFPEYSRFWSSELPSRQFYEEVRDQDFEALLLLPAMPMRRNAYLMEPLLSQRSLINGYWGGDMAVPIPGAGASPGELRAFAEQLRQAGAPYIAVWLHGLDPVYVQRHAHDPPGAAAERGPPPFAWLDALCGPPRIYAADGMAVYAVPGDAP